MSTRSRLRQRIRALDDRDIAIISNNCVAGILYEWAGLAKQSSTAGIYFSGPAYGRFLRDLADNCANRWTEFKRSQLTFKESKHCWALPVEGGGELVFLHYSSPEEAISKWIRRLERMNGKTLFAISSIQGGITLASIEQPLRNFQYTFVVDGDPAPDADEIMLNPEFLDDLVTYIDEILGEKELSTALVHPLCRYN